MQQREIIEHENDLPPEASRSGKNSIYIGCSVRQARQNYGVCLFIVQAYDEDRLNQSMKDCARAMTGNYCEARQMQQEEKAAGKSLYFKERQIKVTVIDDNAKPVKSIDKNSTSYKRGFNANTSKSKSVSASKAKVTVSKSVSDFEKGLNSERQGALAAINDSVQTETVVEQKTTKPSTTRATDTTASNEEAARIKRAKRIANMMRGRK